MLSAVSGYQNTDHCQTRSRIEALETINHPHTPDGLKHGCPIFWLAWAALSKEELSAYKTHNLLNVYKSCNIKSLQSGGAIFLTI